MMRFKTEGTAGRIVAPYMTAWSAEQDLQCSLVMRSESLGVGYVNELPGDRDEHGVLWSKVAERHGVGRPDFARVHPARQRQVMSGLLCQVCARPADRTRDGVLWLMRDFQEDWPSWPEGMASVEPPVCARCVAVSAHRCPALQPGCVAVRVRDFSVVGVRGTLYRPGMFGPVAVKGTQLAYGDPLMRWMVAAALIRELRDCSFVSLGELCATARG